MPYDPLGQQNRVDWGLNSAFADVQPSPMALAANGGPLSFQQTYTPPPVPKAPTERSSVGMLNIGLPMAAPNIQGLTAVPTPPPTNIDQVPVPLGHEAPGPFETTLRGLAGLPAQVLPIPDFLWQHVTNFAGLFGSIFDTPLRMIKPIEELPGGQDVEQGFGQMAETADKRRYEAAIAADPINRTHYMAQYLRQFAQDYASTTNRSRLFAMADVPSESLSDQLAGLLMGTLGATNLLVRRTFVGSSIRDVDNQIINNPHPELLAPELQYLREQFLSQKISKDQLLDDLATSPFSWTNQQGLGGTAASFFLDVFTDPLVLGTFGIGKAASIAETGAIAERGMEAARLLANTDPAAFSAIGSKVGYDGAAIARVMEQTHPTLIKQVDAMPEWAGRTVTRRKRAQVAIQPIIKPAAALANELQNPLGWLGFDRIGRALTAKTVGSVTDGVARAMNPAFINRISKITDRDKLSNSFGNYVSNIHNGLMQQNIVREIQRSMTRFFAGDPNDFVNGRRKVPTTAQEAADYHRYRQRQFGLPRAGIGKSAIKAAEDAAREHARIMLEDLGAAPDAALRESKRMSMEEVSNLHAINYGRITNDFAPLKDQVIKDTQARYMASPPANRAEAEARAANMEILKRQTLVGERELTDVEAKQLLAEVEAKNLGALREAIERYDVLSWNLGGARLPDDVLLAEAHSLLTRLLDTSDGKTRLVHLLDPATLDEPLRSFMLAEKAKYGDLAYRVGLAPEDTWAYVTDPKTGNVVGAHPWVDPVGGTTNQWLPNTMDRLRLGMFTPIYGNRLQAESKVAFTRMAIERDLTHAQANTLYARLMDEASRRMVGPRGLTVETMWDSAIRAENVDKDVLTKIGPRGLAKLWVQAWEGQIKTVGVTSKLSGMIKSGPKGQFAARGNYIGRIAEELYPRARFYLSPFFLFQEYLEGPFFNIIRGNKPGVFWSTRDLEVRNLLERVNTHSRYTDQFEYLFFHRVLEGETRRVAGPGTRFQRLTDKLNDVTIHDQKYLNYVRQWARDAADEMHTALESVQPGLWHLMEQEYGTVNKVDVMLKYLTERGMGREIHPRASVFIMDSHKPPDYGRGFLILHNDLVRETGHQTTAELRAAVRGGRYREATFRDVMNRMNVHPEYTKQAWTLLNRPPANEFARIWREEILKAGADKAEAKAAVDAAMSYITEHANRLGIPTDEWLANRFTNPPHYLSSELLVPTGAFTQMIKETAEVMKATYHGPGDTRYEEMLNRAWELGNPAGMPTPEKWTEAESAKRARSIVDQWYDTRDRRGITGPVDPNLGFSPESPQIILNTAPNRYSGGQSMAVLGRADGAARPSAIADNLEGNIEALIGKEQVEAAREFKSHLGSLALMWVDKMDDTQIALALKGFLRSEHPEAELPFDLFDGDGNITQQTRDELAARIVTSIGASRLDGNPIAGVDLIFNALDEMTRGERIGTTPLSSAGREQIDRLIKYAAPVENLGDTPIAYDYLDTLTNSKWRRWLGSPTADRVEMPAAPDTWAMRSLGVIDKEFVQLLGEHANTLSERSTKRLLTNLSDADRKIYTEDAIQRGRNSVMRGTVKLSDDDRVWDELPDTPKINTFQYEWAIRRLNEEAEWANKTEWHGHKDWTAADMANIHSLHGRAMVGYDLMTPADIFSNAPKWSISSETLPAPHSLHDHVLGDVLPKFDEYPGVRDPDIDPQYHRRALYWGNEASMAVHKDIANFWAERMSAETGVTVLGHATTTGQRPHGGSMPHLLSNWEVIGADKAVDDALNMTGYALQQDSVIATQHFVDRTTEPTAASPDDGLYWAMDFKPDVQEPTVLEALARFLSHKDGFWADHFVLARDADGEQVIRALWTRDVRSVNPGEDIGYEAFKEAVPLRKAMKQVLLDGDWTSRSGLLPGETAYVTLTPRVVKVKMAKNEDYSIEDARGVFASQHPVGQATQLEMEGLASRLQAMRKGNDDPFGVGAPMDAVERQLERNYPGNDMYGGSDYWASVYNRAQIMSNDAGEAIDRVGRGQPFFVKVYRQPSGINPGEETGVILVRDAQGIGWLGGMTVDFWRSGGVKEVHLTSVNQNVAGGQNKGAGFKFYDAIADQRPDLALWNGIGASGAFSEVGGLYAYKWLEHRLQALADRQAKFSTWEWQHDRAAQRSAQLGQPLADAQRDELGKPYLQRLRDSGRADIAQRLVNLHGPDTQTVLGDSLRRHAPELFAANQGYQQAALRWTTSHALHRNIAPIDLATGRARFQRGPSGIRGATAWNARHESTGYVLKTYDRTTALHEVFHTFVEDLEPSGKAVIRDAYLKEHPTLSAATTPLWDVPMEEWAADQWEKFVRDPSSVDNPQLLAVTNAFTKFAAQKGFAAVKPGDLNPDLAKTFREAVGRDYTPAVTYNLDEQKVWEATRIALMRAEDAAHTTHYYNRGRSWLQRSLNHPYLGLYPLSYMWGKVLPEMFRFLVKTPFGLKAPLGGLLMAKDIWTDLQLQVQSDPDFRKFLDEHPQNIQFLQLMLPGTPWETPVNLPVVWRRGLQNFVQNEQRVAKGQPEKGFDFLTALQDMSQYSVGVFRFLGQFDQMMQEWNPAAPQASTGNPMAGLPRAFTPSTP